MKNIYKKRLSSIMVILLVAGIFFSCNDDDNVLAPYAGSRMLSDMVIEDESFTPRVSWVGGYVSVFGVNRGNKAALDSTLVWLIHTDGNNIRFPLVYGELQEGAVDITSQYGGTPLDLLEEDVNYTFWLLKDDVWNQISSKTNKQLIPDSLASSTVIESDTSLNISQYSFFKGGKTINVYINIINVRVFGALAEIFIEPTMMNVPRISWRMLTPGADSLVSAIGMVRGQVYAASNAVWEVYSIRDSAGINLFARDNVIPPPVTVGDEFPQTRTLVEFIPENLQRNTEYHVWIANNTWDREGRARFTPGYGYAVFFIE
jgi:hypothetical protein